MKHYFKGVTFFTIIVFVVAMFSNSLASADVNYYSIQLMACKFQECKQLIKEAENTDFRQNNYARIETRGDLEILLVGRWNDRVSAENRLDKYRSKYPGAYIVEADSVAQTDQNSTQNRYLKDVNSGQEIDLLAPDQRLNVYSELGYLYSQEAEYHKAAEYWEKYLEIEYDPVISSKLAKMYVLTGRYDSAKDLLDNIDVAELSNEQQAEVYDNYSLIFLHEKDYMQATTYIKMSNELEESAERYYRLGLIYQKSKQYHKAENAFEKAVSLSPENTTYLVALGFIKKELKKYDDSALLFEKVISLDPDYLELYEELGYIHTNLINNEEAVEWFKRAIDNRLYYPVDNEEQEVELERNMYRLKKEVVKLTNTFDFTFYESFRTDSDRAFTTPAGTLGGGAIPSQGGMEFAYQPPKIGFRNERIFQVFARVLWNNEPDSLNFEEDSFQGGIGLRYKPLREHTFFISGEKLFEIGDDAINDWLVRALYSKNYGLDLQPGSRFWNYTQIYGDANYLIEDDVLSFFWSGRQGITWNLSNTWLLTPHAVFEGRYQEPDEPRSSFVELGPALSLRYLFGKTNYKVAQYSIEFILQYNFGWFIGDTDSLEDDSFDGLVLNTVLRF